MSIMDKLNLMYFFSFLVQTGCFGMFYTTSGNLFLFLLQDPLGIPEMAPFI